jgi:hypothetical protein
MISIMDFLGVGILNKGFNYVHHAPAAIPYLKKQACLALKAEKGNAIVILLDAYEDSMKLMLQEGLYNLISKQKWLTNKLKDLPNPYKDSSSRTHKNSRRR